MWLIRLVFRLARKNRIRNNPDPVHLPHMFLTYSGAPNCIIGTGQSNCALLSSEWRTCPAVMLSTREEISDLTCMDALNGKVLP